MKYLIAFLLAACCLFVACDPPIDPGATPTPAPSGEPTPTPVPSSEPTPTPAPATPIPAPTPIPGATYHVFNMVGDSDYNAQYNEPLTETTTVLGDYECRLYDALSKTEYGNTCVEIQFNLTDGPIDLTQGGYMLGYDLWIDEASENLSYSQASLLNAAYNPASVNGPAVAPAGEWRSFLQELATTTDGYAYVGGGNDLTGITMLRFKIQTSSENSRVVFALKNVRLYKE